MTVLPYIIFGVICLIVVLIIRNHLVFKYQMLAIEMVDDIVQHYAKTGKQGFLSPYIYYFEGMNSYNTMLFQMHKWKFEDFYSELIQAHAQLPQDK